MRQVFALIGLLVGCLALPTASKLDFDHRVESLFTEEDPDLMAYQKLQRIFGGKSVALLVYQDPDLSGQIGMERNRQITKVIGDVDGVKDVLSVSKLNDALDRFRPSFGVSEIPKLFRGRIRSPRVSLNCFQLYPFNGSTSGIPWLCCWKANILINPWSG